jgi:hypothetical protein
MAISKRDTAIAAAVALLLIGGKKAFASTGGKALADPKADGDALMKRANQKAALAWASVFLELPVSLLTAAALARWAGIESSGNPLAKSRLNERGLMQAGAQSVAEGALTQAEWDALIDPKTAKADQAHLAAKYVDWLASRAAHFLASDPADPIDRIWYAKLYHQRPVDVRDVVGPLTHQLSTTNAHTIAGALAATWATSAAHMHRLRAANVIAWGTPEPGGPTS